MIVLDRMWQARAGLSVTSEMVMLLGLLLLALAMLPAVGNVIGSESETVSAGMQDRIAADIGAHVTKLAHQQDDYIAVTYEPPVDQYTLIVENNTRLTVTVPGADTYTASFQDVLIADVRITDADALCIIKERGDDLVSIQDGACPAPDSNDSAVQERDTPLDISGPDVDTELDTVDDTGSADDLPESDVHGAVGGGQAYVQETGETFCDPPQDADVVSSRSGLEAALADAGDGDVVYVDGGATIDMGFDASVPIPQGVTLASDRGCDGSAGALLYQEERASSDYVGDTMLVPADNARITGLRVRGPRWDMGWSRPEIYMDSRGIEVDGAAVEIDNNEIFGWAHAAVQAGPGTHVHHNFIHQNTRDGLGYGVSGGDDLEIAYNHFRNNRHSVASAGTNSYAAHDNYVDGEAISHIFDVHEPGGVTIEIYRNTVAVAEQVDDDKGAPAVTVRGTPSDRAEIRNNWVYNTEPPCASPGSWPGCAILQTQHGSSSFQNVIIENNHYGTDEPSSCDIGAPRDGC